MKPIAMKQIKIAVDWNRTEDLRWRNRLVYHSATTIVLDKEVIIATLIQHGENTTVVDRLPKPGTNPAKLEDTNAVIEGDNS